MRRLLALSLCLLLAGCVAPPGTGPVLRGRLVMPKAPLRTAMLPSDLVAEATVSLVAPDKTTVAVGLTDVNGAFTITTPSPANGIYHLIAAKRADGDGRLLQLSTLVHFDGSNWTSITRSAPDVVINPTTTALTIVGDALGVVTVNWLNKVDRHPDTNEYTVVDPTLTSPGGAGLAETVDAVSEHVATLVDLDVDPLRGVCFVGEAYADGPGTTPAATPGITRLKVTGFGFDPVPERNSVGFQVGRQFYWTPALPGSDEKTLFVRVPAIPPSDMTSGAMPVPVHVRNGVGALEANVDAVPMLSMQFPRVIPDTAAKLPADPGAPRMAGIAVGAMSGFVNLVWPDTRYGGISPVLRIWNTASNLLASTPPQVALTVSPDKAADPGYYPQVFVHEVAGTTTQTTSHVVWQGRDNLSNRNVIFHRTALNGVWQTYSGGGGPGTSFSVAQITSSAVDSTGPAVLMDDSRMIVAWSEANATGQQNIKFRFWDGIFTNSVPDWNSHSSTYQLTANAASADSQLAQVAISRNGPSGAPYYHVLWHTSADASPGVLQYRRGLPNATATAMFWNPTPVPASPAATWQAAVGAIDDLTFAADPTGNLLAVWLKNGTVTGKSVPAEAAGSDIGALPTTTIPPLPAGAVETAPRLQAVGSGDFYLISASTTANDPEAAGEIWLRRWHAGVWTGPVRVSNSPGIPSKYPVLHGGGNMVSAAWQEGGTMVYQLLVLPI
jgi:hypothetical protein